MNTYRRFTCVNRSVRFFLEQDANIEKELIIYNTDTEFPIELDDELLKEHITVVNNNTDKLTNLPYTNIGSIRRDSLSYATGTHYICWDDDDIFLPWHIRQSIDRFNCNPEIWAWKPFTSMFWKSNHDPELAWNNMEASILIDLEKLKGIGFLNHQGGGEHLHWINVFNAAKKLYIDKEAIPSYCFNWHDQGEMRGHKQSGTIDRVDNFEYHKANTTDYAKSKINGISDVSLIYQKHISIIKRNIGKIFHKDYIIKEEQYQKYCEQYQ